MGQLKTIQFQDRDGSNTYTVPINPNAVDLNDEDVVTVNRTLDGAPIMQISAYDSRARELIWPAYNYNHNGYADMVVELRSYAGQQKQINLRAIDVPEWGWKNIKVVDFERRILNNVGSLRYGFVMTFIFEESV